MNALARAPTVVAHWLCERSLLLSFCLRWTRGDLSEAEDLLSDACIRIMESSHASEIEVEKPIALWATVINNLGRDRIRRIRRWKFDWSEKSTDFLSELPAHTISADHQVFLNECLEATVRKLNCLNHRQRTAVLLRGDGLGYSRIGESLCTSPANARKIVAKARRMLSRRVPREAAQATGHSSKARSYPVET